MPLAYHPVLFFLLFALGASELGLAAFLVHEYNERFGYPGSEFKHRLRFLLFCSVWTVFLAALHFVFNLGVGGFLVFLTVIFWGVGAGLWEDLLPDIDCDGSRFLSRCRQLEAVKGLGWAAFGDSTLALLAIMFTVHGPRTRDRYSYRSGFYA